MSISATCSTISRSMQATNAILIYAEAVTAARKFMSAARRAARVKPVIVVKGGRAEEGARAASSHTGALAGADVVYDAAFRRAGMLRVNEVEELFDAAATLSRTRAAARQPARHRHQWRRRRRARHRPADRGGRPSGGARSPPPSTSSTRCCRRPGATAIRSTSSATPMPSAMPRRSRVLMQDPGHRCAAGRLLPDRDRLVGGGGQGADRRAGARRGARRRRTCSPAGWATPVCARGARSSSPRKMPDYETPERAVRAFMYLVRYRQSQDLLLETPSVGRAQPAGRYRARARHHPRRRSPTGANGSIRPRWRRFFACYGIPFARTEAVADAKAAAAVAARDQGAGGAEDPLARRHP